MIIMPIVQISFSSCDKWEIKGEEKNAGERTSIFS